MGFRRALPMQPGERIPHPIERVNNMRSKWLVALALAAVPGAFAAGDALPGTVNYIQGQVTVNGRAVAASQVGSTTVMTGQTLSVGTGKAEILLTPGTFLRVGNGGAVRMVSSDLADPQVEVVHGEAMVEVDYKPKAARMNVMEHGADTQLLKEGLYKFDAEQGSVEVIDGKASVAENGRNKDIGKGKEVMLADASLKPVHVDTKNEDELYRWSSVRDGYLAQANYASAENLYVDGGWGPGFGLGWYWNPYYATYAWLPGDGFFWSPFGYPFFSPSYVVFAPRIRAYGYRGFGGRPGPGTAAFRGGLPAGRVGGIAAAPRVSAGGFRGGARISAGGVRMGGGGGRVGGGGRR